MKLTIESIFIQQDVNHLCEEVAQQQGMNHKIARLILFIFGGSALYGFTMGLQTSLLQAAASSVKVFVLFFFTLFICLPTLHFIGLFFGYKMRFPQTLVILFTGIAVTSILLGAFSPISLFFLWSGTRYELLLLLHVAIFVVCGAAGLYSIKQNMATLCSLAQEDRDTGSRPDLLLKIWFLLYIFVGTQMSYILAPFIRAQSGILLFNNQQGDFYSYLIKIIRGLLS